MNWDHGYPNSNEIEAMVRELRDASRDARGDAVPHTAMLGRAVDMLLALATRVPVNGGVIDHAEVARETAEWLQAYRYLDVEDLPVDALANRILGLVTGSVRHAPCALSYETIDKALDSAAAEQKHFNHSAQFEDEEPPNYVASIAHILNLHLGSAVTSLKDAEESGILKNDDIDKWWERREDSCFATFDEIDALHTLMHKAGGIYRTPDNTAGCDKFWCMKNVPEFADAMKSRNLHLERS